jgi:hypothetical protein
MKRIVVVPVSQPGIVISAVVFITHYNIIHTLFTVKNCDTIMFGAHKTHYSPTPVYIGRQKTMDKMCIRSEKTIGLQLIK